MRRSRCIVLYLSYSSPILPYSTTKIPFCKALFLFLFFIFLFLFFGKNAFASQNSFLKKNCPYGRIFLFNKLKMKNLRIRASFFKIFCGQARRFRPYGASRLATSGAVARVTRVALSNRKRLQPFYLYSLPTSTPVLGVWLASISIRFWMIGDAKRLRIEVSHARSFPLSISPKDIESEGLFPPVR